MASSPSLAGQRLQWVTRTAILLALTLAFQMLGLPQPLTGPVVNAMLLLSAAFVGVSGGVLIGLLTPWVAFMRGQLPAPLGPMIPFIMVGNALLVIAFWGGRRLLARSKWWGSISGLLAGAVVKFLLLSTAVAYVVTVPPPVAQAMQLPQLITALVGGVIALLVEQAILAVQGKTGGKSAPASPAA